MVLRGPDMQPAPRGHKGLPTLLFQGCGSVRCAQEMQMYGALNRQPRKQRLSFRTAGRNLNSLAASDALAIPRRCALSE